MIRIRIVENRPLRVQLKNATIVNAVVTDPYDGSYEVMPSNVEQTLPTKFKGMQKDITVHEIPLYEVSNSFGTTLVIGE